MMQKKQPSWLKPVSLCIMALLFVSGGFGCRDKKPLYLGFAGPLTGKFADLGIAGRDGVMLAVEEINAGGGIDGRRIDLLSKDDGQNPRQAQQADRDLVNAGVVAIIGHMTSAMSVACLPVINGAHLPMVSPTTSSNELTGLDDYFIRVYPPSSIVAGMLSSYAFKERGIHSISVVYDISNQAHTLGWYKHFGDNYQRLGGSIAKAIPFNSGRQDFSLLAKQIKASGSKGLFILAGAMDTAMICQHLRKSGSTMPVFVSEWSTTNDLLNHGGTSVEGINFYQTFDRNSRKPAYLSFRRNYLARFGNEPTFASVHAYDSAKIVFAALAKDKEVKNLKQAIIGIRDFSGLQNAITIDKYGDPKGEPFMMVVKNGSFQRVK